LQKHLFGGKGHKSFLGVNLFTREFLCFTINESEEEFFKVGAPYWEKVFPFCLKERGFGIPAKIFRGDSFPIKEGGKNILCGEKLTKGMKGF